MNSLKKLIRSVIKENPVRTTRGKRTRRRLGNRRYKFAGLAYNESSKPQRYGPGKTVRNIESYFEAFNHSYFNLNSLLSGNTEHQTMCTLYNYMKIVNIALILFPSQAQISTGYIGIQLNWNDSDNTNIQAEDNTKIVPVFRTRKYFYKFVPLDMPLLLGDSNKPVVINMINYMRTSDNIVIPGCFNFDSEQAFTARIRIVMRIEYRGSKVPNSTGLDKLADKVRKTELTRQEIKRTEIKLDNDAKKQEVEKEDDDDSGDSEFLDVVQEDGKAENLLHKHPKGVDDETLGRVEQ